MDERIEKALEISKYLTTLNNQKRVLQEQFKVQAMHYHNSGQFAVNQTLITFVKTLIDCKQTDAIILDDHNIPIFVENLEEFFNDILNIYFTASNKFLTEYNSLKTKRTVKGLIDD